MLILSFKLHFGLLELILDMQEIFFYINELVTIFIFKEAVCYFYEILSQWETIIFDALYVPFSPLR